jgi:transcriptional regulator with XRE-family HTH domain
MRTYGLTMLPDNGGIVPVLMPFYTAEAHNSLERGSRPYSVVEILREVFSEDFFKAIQCYMDRCPEGAAKAIGVDEARNIKLLWLSEPKVESSLKQPACTTAVDLIFKATVEAMVPCSMLAKTEGNGEQQEAAVMEKRRYTADYRMRYYIGLWHKNCSAPAIAPVAYFPKDEITEQKTAITNQYLLPIMYAEDYVKAGRRMLERYYPEALDKPTAVDGMGLARRMQLEVRRVRFEQGSDIQGRIYFDWTWVKLRDKNGSISKEKIPPMTILINTDLCPTPEIENSTVIHECCHVFLDLPFFKLQMLSGKPFTSYTSRKRKKKGFTRDNGPIDWMELQAEKLPAYVLMEESNTKKEIERLLKMRGGGRSPENIFWTVCQLASIFKVSRSMAKYRMIELGYPEAEGVYCYIDNVRIPDYGCSGTWERGVTYAIALKDAGALLRESSMFAEALNSRCYTYVEGHFCLDVEQYVYRDYRQIARLTAYARHHIEECCISFTVQGRYANTVYEDAQAARKKEVKDKYQSRHGLGAEPGSKERLKENKTFTEDSQIWMKLKMRMPDGIGSAIQLILDEKGITQMELAMRMGVSRTAWRKWCAERMSLRHIVAICIALDVRADIGMELVRLAGHSFLNNKENNILLAMMYETKDLTVARANEILRQEKLAPLTEGRDEEIAC